MRGAFAIVQSLARCTMSKLDAFGGMGPPLQLILDGGTFSTGDRGVMCASDPRCPVLLHQAVSVETLLKVSCRL